ncbi:enoyl-CoA hydratase/isomerase family protein [Actinomadura sp. WMMB 499]|uniref:enoyl-CoA hydratase/isomerase family protein n=1 Tax=Actinomadura sp. WMMB 499 TaxID=1219491 RepID=UPI0012492F1D|nr:enoyl-CoA hydratase/isomerase family protein [Actinomadura sp. WMMB 499]QFG20215.1 enoyl-CoA hydratase/isomerase family protein [Actinomadura sp. WMMB 499]
MSGSDDAVLLRTRGGLGHITLNRPRAINALTHDMVRRIDAALAGWAADDAISTVLIDGAGDRGLCAGGDIRSIYDDARTGGTASADFWRDEYLLNARIARFPKPYVALMDGMVMGGGVGVSAHGGLRVVTERTAIAMPETGIGFVPDVGGTHLLAAAPGELGVHLALTTARMGAGDALLCGFADRFVPSERLADLTEDLASGPAEEVVSRYAAEAPAAELARHRDWIDSAYAAGTVEEILARLRGGPEAARKAAEMIEGKSPTALKVTLRALRRARELGRLEPVLDQEYRVSLAALASHDLVEGIRAQVIDKDRSPRWSPPALDAVTDTDVDRYFASLGDRELGLASAQGAR